MYAYLYLLQNQLSSYISNDVGERKADKSKPFLTMLEADDSFLRGDGFEALALVTHSLLSFFLCFSVHSLITLRQLDLTYSDLVPLKLFHSIWVLRIEFNNCSNVWEEEFFCNYSELVLSL